MTYAQYETALVKLSFVQGLPLTRDAIVYARARHDGQRRDGDGAPFLVHPLEVASMLARASRADSRPSAALRFELEVLELLPPERDNWLSLSSLPGAEARRPRARGAPARRA